MLELLFFSKIVILIVWLAAINHLICWLNPGGFSFSIYSVEFFVSACAVFCLQKKFVSLYLLSKIVHYFA